MRYYSWLAGVALCFTVKNSSACSCRGLPGELLLPRPGSSHPSGAPLLIRTDVEADWTLRRLADPTLHYDYPQPVLLEEAAVGTNLGLCQWQWTAVVPRGDALPEASYDMSFRDSLATFSNAGARAPSEFSIGGPLPERMTRTIQLELGHMVLDEPVVSNTASCADPIFNDHTIWSELVIDVTLDEPAVILMWVESSHPEIGDFSDFATTIGLDRQAETFRAHDELRAYIPQVVEADGCVRIRMTDWLLNSIYDEEHCVVPWNDVSIEFEAEVATSELDSLAEEPSLQRGCTLGSTDAEPKPTAWLGLILVCGAGLLRRRPLG